MRNRVLTFRPCLIALAVVFLFTRCEVSDWLPQMIDVTKDVVTTFIEAKAGRSDEVAEVINIQHPSFIHPRGETSEVQENFFAEIKNIKYLTAKNINNDLRTTIGNLINNHAGTKNVLKLYGSVNNYVLGRVIGKDVHDVLVIKDDGSMLLVFGLSGVFSKSTVESLSHSGDIFKTLDYLNTTTQAI